MEPVKRRPIYVLIRCGIEGHDWHGITPVAIDFTRTATHVCHHCLAIGEQVMEDGEIFSLDRFDLPIHIRGYILGSSVAVSLVLQRLDEWDMDRDDLWSPEVW